MKKVKNDKISVIIPAYNEENTIDDVLYEISHLDDNYQIIVVDDGSIDKTATIARKHSKVEVISHPVNLGQWAALRTGFIAALQNKSKIIVTFDADGQHDSKYIQELTTPILRKEAEIVSGSRFILNSVGEVTTHRKIGIRFFNWIMGIITNQSYSDCTCGFKAIDAEYLRTVLTDLKENQYGTLEFLIKMSKSNIRITEVPIPLLESPISSKGVLKFGYNLLRTIITYT